jgi:hypothetical protein
MPPILIMMNLASAKYKQKKSDELSEVYVPPHSEGGITLDS